MFNQFFVFVTPALAIPKFYLADGATRASADSGF